ncbi:MAG: Branched-chain amino acid transport system permease protein LivM, partial [uncultured Craurococcus sp.]
EHASRLGLRRRAGGAAASLPRPLPAGGADLGRHLHHRRHQPQPAARLYRAAQPRPCRLLRPRRLCQRAGDARLRHRHRLRLEAGGGAAAGLARLPCRDRRGGRLRLAARAARLPGARGVFRHHHRLLRPGAADGGAQLGGAHPGTDGADLHPALLALVAGGGLDCALPQGPELLAGAGGRGARLPAGAAGGALPHRPGAGGAQGERAAGALRRHPRHALPRRRGGDLGRHRRRRGQPLRPLRPHRRSGRLPLHLHRHHGHHGGDGRQGHPVGPGGRRPRLRADAGPAARHRPARGAMDHLRHGDDPLRHVPAARHRPRPRAAPVM